MTVKFYADAASGAFLGSSGSYINQDGDEVFPEAPPNSIDTGVAAPAGAEAHHSWNGNAWIENANRSEVEADRDMREGFEDARFPRLLFEINFDQENRIRVSEGKSAVTKAQYRNALMALIKTL